MSIRGFVRTILGLALVLGAVGCDDNPLSEGREDGSFFMVNPTSAIVEAGDTTKVIATVMNKFGAPINAPVTAEPCDTKVTAVVDPARSAFESPESFLVVGQTLGESCVVVRGGGLTDTSTIRVIPASISGTGVDTLLSGATGTIAVQFRGITGGVVTGFTNAQVSFTALDPLIAAVTSAGEVSARAPGTGRIVVATLPATGATRVDTVRAVVLAGTFTGTVAPSTAGAAGNTAPALTFTEGAIPFDSDTQVRILSVFTVRQPGAAEGTIQLALPYGQPAGTYNYEVSNIGPNQVAAIGTVTIAATPAEDAFGPDDSDAESARAVTVATSEAIYGTLSGEDLDDYVKLTITTSGSYRFVTDWSDGSDIDFLILNAAATAYVNTSMATGAHPEANTITLAAGDYWLQINQYEYVPNGSRATSWGTTIVKQ